MSETTATPRLGKYELRGELGRGAMGVVYRAYDRVLEREVALKTMAGPSAGNAQTVRFLREARTAGGLHHPNIVTIHELGQDSGTYFIAMELLKGRSLYEALLCGEQPALARRLEIVARICDGLDFAHRAGIVHRDIKPANIFLLGTGTVKILDFGIAKIAKSEATRTGLVIGTVDYMSPEQVRAAKDLDGRSDVFSAGVILYELIFGRRPFAADDIGAALHRILHSQPPGYAMLDRILTPELAEVLRRALDKRREARYSRAGEMATVLDAVAAGLHGRGGTEMEERIDEVRSSGLLDGPAADADLPLPCPDGVTAETAPIPSSEANVAKRPRNWMLFAAAVILALGTLWIYRENRSHQAAQAEPPPTAVDVPAQRTQPAEQAETSAGEINSPDETPAVTESVAAAPPVTVEPTPVEPAPVAPQPVAADPGELELLVTPWADVEWAENLDTGERFPLEATAPTRITLPAGRYRLRVSNPYSGSPVDIEIDVRAGESTSVQRTLPGFDATRIVDEILAEEIPRGDRE